MSERTLSHFFRSLVARRRRLVTGAISALGVTTLALGGMATQVSAGPLPSHLDFAQWADLGAGWVSGSLGNGGTGASSYAEGDTVPFRLDVTTVGAGTFDMTVCRDYQNGDDFGYLYLEPYNTTVSPAVVGTAMTNGAFTGVATLGSVSIDNVHEVEGQGDCKAGQRETEVRITISNGPGNMAPVGAYVLWGGHLASPGDPGVGAGHGASEYPGASLSMDNSAATKNLAIKVLKSASLTVQKKVDSGSATPDQFCFTINPDVHSVGQQCPAPGQDTVTFLGLSSGNYTVNEVGVPGYTFASGEGTANCFFDAGALTVNVAVGETPNDASCIFHNRREMGTLTVKQVINPADDPGRFDLEIDGAVAGTGANVGNGGTTGAIAVTAGSHTVGNDARPGTDADDYTKTVACVAGGHSVPVSNGAVTVADGQNVVCTITLTRVTTPTTEEPTTTTTTTEPTTDTTEPTTDTTEPTTDTTEPTTETTEPTSSTTTTTTTVERCAQSRGTKPNCAINDDPEIPAEEVVDPAPTQDAPVVDPGTTVAGEGDRLNPAPVQEEVLAGQVERPVPETPMPAAQLPRTGAGIGDQVTLAFGLVAAGLGLLRVFRRRRPSTQS